MITGTLKAFEAAWALSNVNIHFDITDEIGNYAVYTLVTDIPEYTFSSVTEEITIQLDMYSSDRKTTQDMYVYAENLYDNISLTVSGYTFIGIHREFTHFYKDVDKWRVTVQYRIDMHKDL